MTEEATRRNGGDLDVTSTGNADWGQLHQQIEWLFVHTIHFAACNAQANDIDAYGPYGRSC
jgi:hypothetical protein